MSAAEVADRVGEIRQRMAAAGGSNVGLIAVTKTFGPESWLSAQAAHVDGIGENYAQELVAKAAAVDRSHWPPVHFIGQLQSNKVRLLVGIVDCWQSVDRKSLVDEIKRRCDGLPTHIYVQVNTTNEADKGGCQPNDAADLVAYAGLHGLIVDGLMTVGPTDTDSAATRSAFRLLRTMAQDLGVVGLSMGMSNDLEIAIDEGSTLVRVGSAIFGDRPPQ